MDKYIGIDVHAASCTIAVVDAHGKQAGLQGDQAQRALATRTRDVNLERFPEQIAGR